MPSLRVDTVLADPEHVPDVDALATAARALDSQGPARPPWRPATARHGTDVDLLASALGGVLAP